MQHLTHTGGYNPFYVRVNDRTYELKGFRFYKADGSFIETRSGWFGNNNNIHYPLEIPDVLLRNKEKFDGETFIIRPHMDSIAKKYDKTHAILYIPYEYFDFEIKEVVEDHGYYSTHYYSYTSKKDPNVAFDDYKSKWDVEDHALKTLTIEKLTEMAELTARLSALDLEYSKLDPTERYKRNNFNLLIEQAAERVLSPEQIEKLKNK